MDLQTSSIPPRELAEQLYQQATNAQSPDSNKLENLVETLKHNPGLILESYFEHAYQATSFSIGLIPTSSQDTKYPSAPDSDFQISYMITMGSWGFDVMNEAVSLPEGLFDAKDHKRMLDCLIDVIEKAVDTSGTPILIVRRAIQSLTQLYPLLFAKCCKDNSDRFQKEWLKARKISSVLCNIINIIHQEESSLIKPLCKLLSTQVVLFVPSDPPSDPSPIKNEIPGIELVPSSHKYLKKSEIISSGESSLNLIYELLGISLEIKSTKKLVFLLALSSTVLMLAETRPGLSEVIIERFTEWLDLLGILENNHSMINSILSSFSLKSFKKSLGIMLFQLFTQPRMSSCRKLLEPTIKRLELKEYDAWIIRQEKIRKNERYKEKMRELEREKAEKEMQEKLKIKEQKAEALRLEKIKIENAKQLEAKRLQEERMKKDINYNAKTNYTNNQNRFQDQTQTRKRPADLSFDDKSTKKFAASKWPASNGGRNEPVPLNQSLQEVTAFNINQVIDIVLGNLQIISDMDIQLATDGHYFPVSSLLSSSNSIEKTTPKSGTSRWSHQNEMRGSTHSLGPSNVNSGQVYIQNNGKAILEEFNNNRPVFPLQPMQYGKNFPTEVQDQIPGFPHPAYVPDLRTESEIEIDEEDLLIKLEEGANRVQYDENASGLADDKLNTIAEDEEEEIIKDLATKSQHTDYLVPNIQDEDDITELSTESFKPEISTEHDVKPILNDTDYTNLELDISHAQRDIKSSGNSQISQSDIKPKIAKTSSDKLLVWKESLMRVLLGGEALCEQALDRLGSTSSINNLTALLRLHIPNFSTQWPLSSNANFFNNKAREISTKERVADWMVLVSRTLVQSLCTNYEINLEEKAQFIYQEVILQISKTPKQSYEMCIMLLIELYHQIYSLKSKQNNNLLDLYSKWSSDIGSSILDSACNLSKITELIVPLSTSEGDIVKSSASKIFALERDSNTATSLPKLDSDTKSNSNLVNSINHNDVGVSENDLDSVSNFKPTNYELVLINKHLPGYQADYMFNYISEKSNFVIMGKLKDSLLARYLIDIPTISDTLFKSVKDGLTHPLRGVVCIYALHDLYKSRPKYKNQALLALLSSTASNDRTVQLNSILVIKQLYATDQEVIRDYVVEKLLGLVNNEGDLMNGTSSMVVDEREAVFSDINERDTIKISELYVSIMSLDLNLLENYFIVYSKLEPKAQSILRKSVSILIQQICREGVINIGKETTDTKPEIKEIVECPKNAETLLLRAVILISEQENLHFNDNPTVSFNDCSGEIMLNANRMLSFVKERNLDGRYLIPVLDRMTKQEIVDNLVKTIALLDGSDETTNLFKTSIKKILSAKTFNGENFIRSIGEDELVCAFHYLDEKKVGLEKLVPSIQILFGMDMFPPHILASSMKSIVNSNNKLPVILMRSIMTAYRIYPVMKSFLANLLTLLVNNSIADNNEHKNDESEVSDGGDKSKSVESILYQIPIWNLPKIWRGFIICCNILAPESFFAIKKLPDEQKHQVFAQFPHLKDGYDQMYNPSEIKENNNINEIDNQNEKV
ncbi:hypothetical protein BB559_002215 [Furculomyces boomerangus]|uniref:Symplekin/Pta1 N-terminal domain-containing protein n=1 Tax=Furculomyces boomerangus TaxID=61424 RepID=A0A2T9YX18_9FUNG|nr:hypothetical protein BB559_002215 [Furculomyces boomerangus]